MKNTSKDAVKAASRFLKAYKAGDHYAMYEACTPTWQLTHKVEKLKEIFNLPLASYQTGSAFKVTEVVYDVNITLGAADGNIKAIIRVICEKEAFKPSINGEFKVNPVSIRKL